MWDVCAVYIERVRCCCPTTSVAPALFYKYYRARSRRPEKVRKTEKRGKKKKWLSLFSHINVLKKVDGWWRGRSVQLQDGQVTQEHGLHFCHLEKKKKNENMKQTRGHEKGITFIHVFMLSFCVLVVPSTAISTTTTIVPSTTTMAWQCYIYSPCATSAIATFRT